MYGLNKHIERNWWLPTCSLHAFFYFLSKMMSNQLVLF